MFTEQTFRIPKLTGISERNITEHLKLYAGYVKHANLILEKIAEFEKEGEGRAYEIMELQRRLSFEFDGMRNHECYFGALEGGAASRAAGGPFEKALEREWGSCGAWLARFKQISKTRGIGWAMLLYDPVSGKLLNNWVDEQHLGHLNGCRTVIALDMWEHAYVADYQPSGKGKYVDDFFENLNWTFVERNYEQAKKN